MGVISEVFGNQEDHKVSKNNVYYDDLLPKESKVWAPIRRWEKRVGFVTPLIWSSVLVMFLIHAVPISYAVYFFYSGRRILLASYIFTLIYCNFAIFGISAAIHRLWSHRAYKPTIPVKILMFIAYAATGEIPISRWVLIHRVHHRKTDTSADPHDITRGFFFAHMGWLIMRRHPHVVEESKKVDMSDITSDPMIQFFDRHFRVIISIWAFVVPTLIPVYFFGETLSAAILLTSIRYLLVLHSSFTVNSIAHSFGAKPYNQNIRASQNMFANFISFGEGLHNYHHTFPSDYRSTENPISSMTTVVLEVFKYFGLIYDTKQVSQSYIYQTADKKGDGNLKSK